MVINGIAAGPAAGLRIGVIGVGGVARYAHLPAYRSQGLRVSAVHDRDPAVARAAAAEFDIATIAATAQELAERDDVDVIDIATPPATHATLIATVAATGKPMLVQKPLCTTEADLAEIVRVRERSDAWIRLNLTGRYVSAWRRVAEVLADGTVGEPFLCTIRNRDWWDREPGRWDHDVADYIVFEMMIHHLDLCRMWFGQPRQVAARTGSHPAQAMRQANWVAAMVEYDAPQLVQFLEDWTMREFSFASGHPFEEVLVSGDRGVIRATSERVEVADDSGNRVRVWHLPRPGQVLPGDHLRTGWFPDSFGAAMADFLLAVADGTGRRRDWEHLIAVTEDTFAVCRAARAGDWLSFGRTPAAAQVAEGAR